MFLTDYIKVYETAIPHQAPNDLCEELIRRFNKAPGVDEISTTDDPKKDTVRSCLELNVTKSDIMNDIQPVLLHITEIAIAKYQKDISGYIFPEKFGCEQFRMVKYRAGEKPDHFDYHVSVNNYASARRFLTLQWHLNDVQTGGETHFPHFNIRVPAKKGRLMIFPANWMYPHGDEAPISNDKYVVGTYLHYQ